MKLALFLLVVIYTAEFAGCESPPKTYNVNESVSPSSGTDDSLNCDLELYIKAIQKNNLVYIPLQIKNVDTIEKVILTPSLEYGEVIGISRLYAVDNEGTKRTVIYLADSLGSIAFKKISSIDLTKNNSVTIPSKGIYLDTLLLDLRRANLPSRAYTMQYVLDYRLIRLKSEEIHNICQGRISSNSIKVSKW